jgi:predicted RND superfamily exporter protein
VLVGVLLVLLTAGAFVGTQNLTIEEFGEPAQNFPEDDPLRQEHEKGIRGFYDLDDENSEELKTNVVVFQGDNTDLQSHRYIEAAQEEMSEKENLRMSTSRNLPFLMRTWLTVKDGGPGAAEQIGRDTARNCDVPTPDAFECQGGERADNYPQTREEIQRELDAMFDSPLDTFASLFVAGPHYNISTMTLATTTGDFHDAEAAWNDVWASLDAVEDQRPTDVEPAFVGNPALNYLFITEELPWLSYLGIVSGIVLAFLTAIFTKDMRATAAVMVTMGLTGVWWLGVLPAFDIGLAITLMLPAVFITSIGADYAIHMTWNLIKNPDRDEVYGVVGKAVLFSAITDIGAFAIFTQTQNVAASEAMVATVIAIAVMFVVTILVMPIFYPNVPTEADRPETREQPAETPGTRVVEST